MTKFSSFTGAVHQRKGAVDLLYTIRVVGMMCLTETFFLALCFAVALFYGGGDALPFLYTTLIMFVVGATLVYLTRNRKNRVQGYREGALAVVLTWITLSLLGMMPFIFGGYTSNAIDAFFETVSGLTTTGATTYATVEHLPHGILLWRSLIQWQGGIGIIVFTMALSPALGGGGGSLYNAETSGITHERFLPRIKKVAQRLWILYLGLTIVLIGLLALGPMNFFDAVCHALSCLSTGGFSTRNDGILAFNSIYTEYVLIVFMFIGSLNLSLLYMACVGKPKKLLRDEEFHWYGIIILGYTLLTFVVLLINASFTTGEETFRQALFQVVSLSSSTGFLTSDTNTWGPFFVGLSLPIMFVCGCAGSTSGGLKVSRFMVMIKNLNNEFKKRIHPNMVANVRFNSMSVNSDVVIQVLAFISLYLLIIILGTIAVTLVGNDFTSSITSVLSCISNVGPSSGKYTMHYANAGEVEKLILSFVMLAGRLEVFTFVGVLLPSFRRK